MMLLQQFEPEQWVFLYPLEHFERNAPDKDIVRAYDEETYSDDECPVQKLSLDEFAEMCNDNGFNDQGYYVRFIKI